MERRKKKISHRHLDYKVGSEGADPIISRRRFNPIKLAYNPRRPDGRPHSDQRL